MKTRLHFFVVATVDIEEELLCFGVVLVEGRQETGSVEAAARRSRPTWTAILLQNATHCASQTGSKVQQASRRFCYETDSAAKQTSDTALKHESQRKNPRKSIL